ncbi:hypothetical protein DASB73_004130 [Starmerella bacillaris]|uniref:Nuclear pore complex protein Nup85 n=1 Tax=Starmerella bacillaris TaxID=1247836 RepID=A0AAV5RDN7_STABA|nr:hypothetical protein DASB73_004130 [Starmerella bacillaris]
MSLDDKLVTCALEAQNIMVEYAQARADSPFDDERCAFECIQSYLDLLEGLASPNEPLLQEAITVVKCFQCSVFPPENREAQIRLVREWTLSMIVFDGTRLDDVEPDFGSRVYLDLLTETLLLGDISKVTEIIASYCDSAPADLGPLLLDLCTVIDSYPMQGQPYSVFMVWRKSALLLLESLKQKYPLDCDLKSNLNDSNAELISFMHRTLLILSGDAAAIKNAAPNWCIALNAFFIFADPLVDMLPMHYEQVKDLPRINEGDTYEDACRALFGNQIVAAIAELNSIHPTSAVVLGELCSNNGLFDSYDEVSAISDAGVSGFLALQYVEFLFSDKRLVGLGTQTLVNLNTEGAKNLAKKEFPRLVLIAPDFSEDIVMAAQDLGLLDLDLEVSGIAADYLHANGEYLRAMEFYYRANQLDKLHHCAKELFKKILIARDPYDADSHTVNVLNAKIPSHVAELPAAIMNMLAPSAVLLDLMKALLDENIKTVHADLDALLHTELVEFYPLLVQLVIGVPANIMARKYVVMLMKALNKWDDAPQSTKQQTVEYIQLADGCDMETDSATDLSIGTKFVLELRHDLANKITL